MNNAVPFELLNKENSLDFIWLELTNRCNLECVHCYTSSSPEVEDENPLSFDEYRDILTQTSKEGCTAVQFIGGEPTLNKMLPDLIREASSLGFTMIEVYSNLVHLSDDLVELFKSHSVQVATSVYSYDPIAHDLITTRPGSWRRTVENIKKVQTANLELRVSIIEMELNAGHSEDTIVWLNSMNISNVGVDWAREFGRAEESKPCDQGELCGECSHGKLCVSPDGVVTPCIMSKAWPVGSVKDKSVEEILCSETLKSTRKEIYDNTLAKRGIRMGGCNPDSPNPCGPDSGGSCNPCSPTGHCGPNACRPN